jgi:hypothetical protein
VVVLGLAAGLGLAYRAHRKVLAQQHATEGLYEFVKDLGPLQLDSRAPSTRWSGCGCCCTPSGST